ncbi:tRNA (N6-isopentenyl adenosine(37)-C2)-methylthiotransferase MiaB [bacterium]|nr:tRNA (N6-isopentenyl adenosine(37)-C2)-methylthiotransferase MiaB [candidate division CSSED10-310 bacterium]
MMERVCIKTFGCQMNEHDSERLAGVLRDAGCRLVVEMESADVIILNTCSVRPKAEDKAASLLGRLSGWKSRCPGRRLGIAGCMAQHHGRTLFRRFPYLDFVVGPRSVHRIHEVLSEVRRTGRACLVDLGDTPIYGTVLRRPGVSASITIMEGCDNFCSYCIVPHVRGREHSRPSAGIIAEVEEVARRGFKEVLLLGQNVNSYNRGNPDDLSFPELLRAVAGVAGIDRLRFVTSHPRDMSPELIACFGELPQLCEFLHLPVQSGSDAVLRRMNRGYTRAHYLGLVEALRRVRPGIAFSTDVIVGYPGERDEDFEATLDLVRKVRFDTFFSFHFSTRPGTTAAGERDTVPLKVKRDRLLRLNAVRDAISLERNRALIGTTVEVLAAGFAKRCNGPLVGRTRSHKLVHFSGSDALVGKLVQVRIDDATTNCLYGELR